MGKSVAILGGYLTNNRRRIFFIFLSGILNFIIGGPVFSIYFYQYLRY